MDRSVQIYIEGVRLELFNDEKINVSSSVQNISDISKVFTDFSQTFTVPASPHNNELFQHFYQNDVDSTIDYGIRRKAFIEIDLTFFRRGLMSLEKATLKKGSAENYSVTFYGDVLTLKDKFGEDELSNLDYNAYNHLYNGVEVQNRITDDLTPYDVRYPLISSLRVWQYNTIAPVAGFPSWFSIGTPDDIYDIAGQINFSELFPALRISSIFDAIQTTYGITFQGLFLTDKRFTDMFLLFKNKQSFNFMTATQQVNLIAVTAQPNIYNLTSNFDLVNDRLDVYYLLDGINHSININVTNLTGVGTYFVDVFQNGNLFQTLSGTAIGPLPSIVIANVNGLNENFTFFVRANNPLNIKVQINYSVKVSFQDPLTLQQTIVTTSATATTNPNNLVSFLDLASLAPKQKVTEFFSGILKEFNLTCNAISENVYEVEPLEFWYQKGAIINITKFTDVDTIEIDRVKLFKKIAFNYTPSESFLNKAYFQNTNKNYGDTTNQYIYDGGTFEINQPFENLLFNRFTGTDLQVGYLLNEAMSPYIPKPILLYKNSVKATDFKFNNGLGVQTVLNYIPFGQDINVQNINYTSNFGAEISTMLNVPIQQTLFATYYFPYLANLFNLKNRLTTVKTNLPVSLLTSLQLNDRLIIRDKRYIINEMKSDLTSGDTTFVLLHDFRTMIPIFPFFIPQLGGNITVPILVPNGFTLPSSLIQATLSTVTPSVVITPSVIFGSQDVVITIPAVTQRFTMIAENNDYINTEDFNRLRSEQGDERLITIQIDYEFANGELLTNQFFINQ